ncbi:hypothetical protein [Desulfotomaculum copahuensis]|uniref:hypothetical protein n=1 Tax=Desulfotomaculum copahuensis TaxID=1838280 RepID=UPI001372BE3B
MQVKVPVFHQQPVTNAAVRAGYLFTVLKAHFTNVITATTDFNADYPALLILVDAVIRLIFSGHMIFTPCRLLTLLYRRLQICQASSMGGAGRFD